MTYAANTDVSVERSRAELERTLQRYGASAFGYATRAGSATVAFEAHGRRITFELKMPDINDRRFTHTAIGRTKSSHASVVQAWEQACRQKWRALNLVVKAKLEAVEAGISEFEDEFLAFIALPNGGTVGEWMKPQIAHAYEQNQMPELMVGPTR